MFRLLHFFAFASLATCAKPCRTCSRLHVFFSPRPTRKMRASDGKEPYEVAHSPSLPEKSPDKKSCLVCSSNASTGTFLSAKIEMTRASACSRLSNDAPVKKCIVKMEHHHQTRQSLQQELLVSLASLYQNGPMAALLLRLVDLDRPLGYDPFDQMD